MKQYAKPIQRAKASRLYRTNHDARADLDQLGDAAEADSSIDKAAYLAAEKQIIDKHSGGKS